MKERVRHSLKVLIAEIYKEHFSKYFSWLSDLVFYSSQSRILTEQHKQCLQFLPKENHS